MAYLEDFYPLDIDDSYLEYVISELKCDDNDILLLDIVKLVIEYSTTRLLLLAKAQNGEMTVSKCVVMKALQN